MPLIQFPFHGALGKPIIDGTLRIGQNPPLREKFVLDTGADVTIISKPCWARFRMSPKPTGPPKSLGGIGGKGIGIPTGPAYILLPVNVEYHRFEMETVYLNQDDTLPMSLLGRDFLSKYRSILTFNFQNRTISFEYEEG